MTKTKNALSVSPNTYRNRRLVWGSALLLGPAAFIGAHVVRGGNAEAGVSQAQLIRQGVTQLEDLQAKHPNILSVAPDAKHKGLEKVTYTFTPGHNTISHLATDVAPGQIIDHADADIESYNGNSGSDITHLGQKLTVDVDPATGFIVENPDLPPSAQDSG